MSERLSGPEPERRPIHREIVSLEEGPIDIELDTHLLRIVDPIRDLGQHGWNVDYLVIDPNDYEPEGNRGYKGLWEGEDIRLGREYTHDGRFEFSGHVSRAHVLLRLKGRELEIVDLNSTNGTYRLIPRRQTTGRSTRTRDTRREGYVGTAELAGKSIPSELHPERNEDAFFVDQTSRALGVFDGVSGAPGSELASQLASEAVAKHLRSIQTDLPRELSHLAMYETLYAGHEAIIKGASGRDIATTAAVAKVFETEKGTPYAVVASVGDSRAFLFRDRQLTHLTLDQAYYLPGHDEKAVKLMQMTLAEATDLSKLSEKERQAFRYRNVISSYLGGGSNNRPVITVNDFEVQEGDRLVITTDGIHDNLTNSEIEALLRQMDSSDVAVNALVQAALLRSKHPSHIRAKHDDMTAVALSL